MGMSTERIAKMDRAEAERWIASMRIGSRRRQDAPALVESFTRTDAEILAEIRADISDREAHDEQVPGFVRVAAEVLSA